MESSILFGLSWLRSSVFTAESFLLPVADFWATGRLPRLPFTLPCFLRIQLSLAGLLRADANRIAEGVYPASVLLAEPATDPLAHLQRLPLIFREAMAASRRRMEKRTKQFSNQAREEVHELPEYYARNFHFQKDGYLSQESADLYDHQVELLFAGAADAMRRLLIAPLKHALASKDGSGLRILELGCGAGSATSFLKAALPEAEIVAVDLSKAYLSRARKRVKGVEFREANAEDLPFRRSQFHAVVSVFLFHELPLAVRKQVLAESRRVLKRGGVLAYVDSLQLGDDPQFDEALRLFPQQFHEPFYTNYIKTPMGDLLAEAGLAPEPAQAGFFSRVQVARVSRGRGK